MTPPDGTPVPAALPPAEQPVRARIPTLRKMAELLRVFTPARPKWRFNELSAELGWDGATTHRFLKALVELRMLDEREDGSYAIGMLPVELAAVHVSTEPRRRELLRRCEEIAEATGFTTQLGVLDGDRVAIVASHEGSSMLKAAAMLGERLPLHATAAGKAILTELGDDEIEALLPAELEALTANTKRDRSEVLDEIRAARADGLAHARSELSEGLMALAIPLPRGYFDVRPAALTCAGPGHDGTSERWAAVEEVLRAELSHVRAAIGRTDGGDASRSESRTGPGGRTRGGRQDA